MEWLSTGKYTLDLLHPPLARVAVAIGPYTTGERFSGNSSAWAEGNRILHSGDRYVTNLSLARMGILPFYLASVLIVWRWTQRLFGSLAGIIAAALFSTLPPILGHAGIATTDMASAAAIGATAWIFSLWTDHPTLHRAVASALMAGAAILTKLSAILFLPVCGLVVLIAHYASTKRVNPCPNIKILIQQAIICLLTIGIVIWSGYLFSTSSLRDAEDRPHEFIDRIVGTAGILHDIAYKITENLPVPASSFFRGIMEVRAKNEAGHAYYLMGKKLYNQGSWLFFPVVLGVKTPIAFLLFFGCGAVFTFRQARSQKNWKPIIPCVSSIAILAICLPSDINLGVRHILTIYVFMAVTAGAFAATLLGKTKFHRVAPLVIPLLLGWHFIDSFRSHPDYLAYFNEIAASRPERFLIDSDLDWGQDLGKLPAALRQRGIDHISIAYFGSADLNRHALPKYRILVPNSKSDGWIAISLHKLKCSEGYEWLENYTPVAVVGRSIYLYHIKN